jgi:DNA-binding CsgD family transcriptional regulator
MISIQAYSELLETLHSAPLDHEHWQRFLARICELTGSVYGIFASNDSAMGQRILAHSGMPMFAEAHRTYNESFRHKDPFRERFLQDPRVGVIEGQDLCPHQELVKTDLYREFLRPLELHHMTFMVLSMAPRKYELVSMWRGAGRPELEADEHQLLQMVMPHVQTALRVRQMIGQAEYRAQTAEALLDTSLTASILLDGLARVVYMNKPAQALAEEGDGFRLQGDHVVPTERVRRAAFKALVADAVVVNQRAPGGAISLERPGEKRALQVLVTPFPHGVGVDGAKVLVLATDPERVVHFPDAILRALYDLTPAETEIANGLLTGFSLDEVATLRRVSVTTVRSQMKSLLGKTETRRQGELIRLLSSLPRTAPVGIALGR